MFELDGVELEFTEDALEAVAEQALLRGTGARGLRAILEEVLLDVMYDLPGPHRRRQVRDRPVGRAGGREPHARPAERAARQSHAEPPRRLLTRGRRLTPVAPPFSSLARGARLARQPHRLRVDDAEPGVAADPRPHAASSSHLLGNPRADLPLGAPDRHQRQGVHRRHDHGAARGHGPLGRDLHEPQPARSTSGIARNGIPSTTSRSARCSPRWPPSSRMLTERPTRFELLTAAGLAWFADEAVDAVGHRGRARRHVGRHQRRRRARRRLTNVSYDHTEVLGPTLEGIAARQGRHRQARHDRGGGRDRPRASSIIATCAGHAGAGASRGCAGRDFDCTANRLAVGGRLVDLRTPGGSYGEVLVPLHGPHQGLQRRLCAGGGRGVLRCRPRRGGGRRGVRPRSACRAASRCVGRRPLIAGRRGPQRGRHDRRSPRR